MTTTGRDSYIREVRVELADGHNFVGTVWREYYDNRRRRTLLVRDSRGNERVVRTADSSVTVHDLEDGQDGDSDGRGGQS